MSEYRLLFEHKPSHGQVTVHVEIGDVILINGRPSPTPMLAAWHAVWAACRPWGNIDPKRTLTLVDVRRLA